MAGKSAKRDIVPRPTGRQTIRTEAMIEEILERVTNGEPLAQVLRSEGMPGVTAFYDWLNKDPVLDERFARAREYGHDAIATDALRIIDTPPAYKQTAEGMSIDQGDVQNRKLQFEGRLKLLSKWDRRYADKVDLNHSGKIGLESLIAGSE